MSDTNAEADEPFFEAMLTPDRSLGRTGFAVLMGALLFGWLATGAIFLANGAWPVDSPFEPIQQPFIECALDLFIP